MKESKEYHLKGHNLRYCDVDRELKTCVMPQDMKRILEEAHEGSRHFRRDLTFKNV